MGVCLGMCRPACDCQTVERTLICPANDDAVVGVYNRLLESGGVLVAL
jgi:hypothetical protein